MTPLKIFDDCSCISATLCVQIFEEAIQINKESDTKEKPNTIISVMGKKPGHPKQSNSIILELTSS